MVIHSLAELESSLHPIPSGAPNIIQEDPHIDRAKVNSHDLNPCLVPDKQPLRVVNTTTENMNEDVDTAYEALISRAGQESSDLFDIFNEFESQQTDYEWSQNYEQKIREFISLHELSYSVAINTIVCKSSICELSVTIYEPSAWSSLIGDMWGQQWWNFSLGEHESVDNNIKQETYFYYLFKEVYIR